MHQHRTLTQVLQRLRRSKRPQYRRQGRLRYGALKRLLYRRQECLSHTARKHHVHRRSKRQETMSWRWKRSRHRRQECLRHQVRQPQRLRTTTFSATGSFCLRSRLDRAAASFVTRLPPPDSRPTDFTIRCGQICGPGAKGFFIRARHIYGPKGRRVPWLETAA